MGDIIDVTLPENLAHQCVKCSACRSVCPTYSVVKQERSSPRGRLALAEAVVDGVLPLTEEIAQQWNECAMCRRCEWICPNEVEYKDIMFRARAMAEEKKKSKFDPVKTAVYQGLAMTGNFVTKVSMKFAPSLMNAYGKLFKKDVPEYNAVFLNTGIPKFTKLLPKPTAKPFGLRGVEVKPEKSKGRLLFFTGCMIDAFYGKTGESVIKLMEKAGYEVVVPENIRCCGAPQLYSGYVDLFEKLYKHNKEEIDKYEFDYIVVACPTCGGALEEEYGYPVKDFAEILREEGYLVFKGEGERVTFHFPCHSYTAMSTDPNVYRDLLKGVIDAEYVEGEDAMMCCGFAGYFSVSNYEVATEIQKRKVKDIEKTQAQYVLSDCPGCIFNIADGMYKHGDYKNIKIVHLADYLAERLIEGGNIQKPDNKEEEEQSVSSVY
ncbi:(Fe-S)-binding protein [Persephonella sp. KM09-Lau-8]|uniref:(Fe-S)-binding protein n=1 Tax=Persephonella sp. KM09-Lau-8 TaxID=1158345 RepID=UPI0004984C3E|nr:(Fe-S)-binding protein [Persephonella sp. KM09-Lau-8]